VIEPGAVEEALKKLKNDAEPEAGFMRMCQGYGSHPSRLPNVRSICICMRRHLYA